MKTDLIIKHIVHWLKDCGDHSETDGFCVGVSGGIDSAVTSTLAAATGRPVICLEMPIHQNASQDSRARKHVDMIRDRYENVTSIRADLTPLFDCFAASMPPAADENSRLLTLANTRARLRMTTLYYFAGLNNHLVTGTGNKVEDFGVGFFTKYGDGGVDISPIADLNKTQVYALGKSLGIIDEIITAEPTDGLWGDDRTDADQIGAGYDELEWAMEYDGKNTESLTDRQSQVLQIYHNLHLANKHKMDPIPVCRIPSSLLAGD